MRIRSEKAEKREEFKKKFDAFKEGKDFDGNTYFLFGETYEEYKRKSENCWRTAFGISSEEDVISEHKKSKKVLIENLLYELGNIAYFSDRWVSRTFVAGFFHKIHLGWIDPCYWFEDGFVKYWGDDSSFACRFLNCMRTLKSKLNMEQLENINLELENLKKENTTDKTAVTLIECLQGIAVESYRSKLQQKSEKSSGEDSDKVDDRETAKQDKHLGDRYIWIKDIPGSGASGVVELYMDTKIK